MRIATAGWSRNGFHAALNSKRVAPPANVQYASVGRFTSIRANQCADANRINHDLALRYRGVGSHGGGGVRRVSGDLSLELAASVMQRDNSNEKRT